MIKYFVKKHCEATEVLNIAVGGIQDYYYGKTPLGGYVCKDREPKSFEGTLYGLGSQQEAEKLLAKMQPNAEAETAAGRWVVSLSIVEA
jgi:hypothetical protein